MANGDGGKWEAGRFSACLEYSMAVNYVVVVVLNSNDIFVYGANIWKFVRFIWFG